MVIDIPFEPDHRSDEIRAISRWRNRPKFTKDFGTRWLRDAKECVPEVPSIVVPDENDYLINPSHPGASRIRVVSIDKTKFDLRLWTVTP
jgi:RES domain-containing protein